MKHNKRVFDFVLFFVFGAVACVLIAALFVWPGSSRREPKPSVKPDVATQTPTPVKPADDFQLGGITLESGPDDVRSALGEPKAQEALSEPSPHDESITVNWTSWTYDGAQVVFMTTSEKGKPNSGPGEVHDVLITAPGVSTSRGIAVGDPVAKLKEAYPDLSEQDGALCLWNGMKTARLEFSIIEGVVKKITLYTSEW